MAENQAPTKMEVTVETLEAQLDAIVNLCGGIKSKDIADMVAEIKKLMHAKFGEEK